MKYLKIISAVVLPVLLFLAGCGLEGSGSDSTWINISDASGGASNPDTVTVAVGGTATLYAAGYDDDEAYVMDEDADWTGCSSIANYSASGASITLTGSAPGLDYLVATVNELVDSVLVKVVPAAPTGLKSVTEYQQVSLSWTDTQNSNVRYKVYKSENADGSGASEVADITAKTYTATGLALGTKYYFYVTAHTTVSSVLLESDKTGLVDDAPAFNSTAVKIYKRSGVGFSCLDLSASVTYSLSTPGTDGLANADIFLENDMEIWGVKNAVLASVLSAAWEKETYITDMGAATFDDESVSVAPEYPSGATWASHATAVSGHVYALRTAEGNYCKMRVDFIGSDYIEVSLNFQDIAGYTNFKTAAK